MHEMLRKLAVGTRVLDLGARDGSFGLDCCPGRVIVRLDIDAPRAAAHGELFVRANAAQLPFARGSFNAIVANHSLEHICELSATLREIGRVVAPTGGLFVAVPDASTLSDRIYRWVYHGGGHVNAFRSADALAREISLSTGLALRLTRPLGTSYGFLARRHFKPRPPRRLWLFGNGNMTAIAVLSYTFRVLDRCFGSRLGIYGWAFYFGNVGEGIESNLWTNVCVGCGVARSSADLTLNRRVRRHCMCLRSYVCEDCGAWNLFTRDRSE